MGSTAADRLTSEHKIAGRSWLQEQREAIRARGLPQIEFKPLAINGEPLSVTIIRERRGDFDDPLH
jgi:hypothetical protein